MFGASKLANGIYYDHGSHYKSEDLIELEYFQQLASALRTHFISNKNFDKIPDIIIFSCVKDENTPQTLNNNVKLGRILLIVSCENGYNSKNISKSYDMILQSYLEKDDFLNNIYPMPIGIPNYNFFRQKLEKFLTKKDNQNNKDIALFYSGNLNKNRIKFFSQYYSINIIRKIYIVLLFKLKFKSLLKKQLKLLRLNYNEQNKNVILFNSEFHSGLSKNDYLDYLSRAKYTLCPQGFSSYETFRHYEQAAFGSFSIVQKLPKNWIYNNFPCIKIKSWKNLHYKLLNRKNFNGNEYQLSVNWYLNTIDPIGASNKIFNMYLNSKK